MTSWVGGAVADLMLTGLQRVMTCHSRCKGCRSGGVGGGLVKTAYC